VSVPMTLIDPWPGFQGHCIVQVDNDNRLTVKVTIKHYYETKQSLSNGATFDDHE